MRAVQTTSIQNEPEVWVTRLENTTTGTNLLNSKGAVKFHKVSVIFSHGVQISLPPGSSCPVGHFVMLDFIISVDKSKYEMRSTGKVTSTSIMNEALIVEIEFKRYDKKAWQEVLENLHVRQSRVDEIFRRVKGE